MGLGSYLPFRTYKNEPIELLTPAQQRDMNSRLRVAALALGRNSLISSFSDAKKKNFEEPDQDLDRIYRAIDTDSYAKRAFSKHQELFWKQGWEIVGENPAAVDYLWQRIDHLEIAMNRPFQEFLEDISDQMIKFSNCFAVKARGDLEEYFPTRLRTVRGSQPLLGFYLIPTETVQVMRTKNNKPLKYRQNSGLSDSLFRSNTATMPSWLAKDVIHFHTDKKPGRAFGTPFISASLEDIISLRQMEEDIQNLVHMELFPIYKYKIGTDEQPASKTDIDEALVELEAMRTESGLVMPHTHDLETVEGNPNPIDADPYLAHFKERVAVGLGVFPHHLGMSRDGGNRSVTDRLDAALYDSTKHRQRKFSELIRFHVFNELLWEGGFNPYVNPARSQVSDRCELRFNEIDLDSLVKREAHTISKWTSNIITYEEGRMDMNMKPDLDKDKTFAAIAAEFAITQEAGGGAPPTRTSAKASKGANNVVRPANQHGKRTSPNIRRSADNYDILEQIVELFDEEELDG
jgi:hypothetical protein